MRTLCDNKWNIGRRSMSPKTLKTHWVISFKPETSGLLQNVPDGNIYQKCRAAMTYDVPFVRHMTSNETYDFGIFYKFVNVVSTDLKIGTHIDWIYNMYIAKIYINKSNVTYASMATKYPIIKHRLFFRTLTAAISTINTRRIHMKLRMEIPVLHAYFV